MVARSLTSRQTPTPPSPLSEPLTRLYHTANVQGVESLSDHDLVTLLFDDTESFDDTQSFDGAESNKQTRLTIEHLLASGRGLSALSHLRPHALVAEHQLTQKQANRLAAALQLGTRAHRDALLPPPDAPLSYDLVVQWARPRLSYLEHEEVWVLCVNSHTALRSAWQVGRGGMHGCGLLARDLLLPVVRDGASGFILVHNHPSGDPTPSSADIDLTRGIQLAASSLCIPLLDHVVVARGGARSFFELGYLDR